MKRAGFLLGLWALSTLCAHAYTAQDYYKAGLQLYSQGQYQNAARYFQAAVQLDPQNWQAFQGLGQSYYQLGQSDDALKAFDQSLQANPNNPSLRTFADN